MKWCSCPTSETRASRTPDGRYRVTCATCRVFVGWETAERPAIEEMPAIVEASQRPQQIHPVAYGVSRSVASWLYVATDLATVWLPNGPSWGVATIYSRKAVSNPWRAYYRMTPDVFAWLIRRVEKLEEVAVGHDDRMAVVRGTVVEMGPLWEFANVAFDDGELTGALGRSAPLPKAPAMGVDVENDMR